jgi:hypothetical protein
MLRDNRSNSYYSSWSYGGTHRTLSAGSSDTGRGEVSGIASGVWGVGLTFTPFKELVAYRCNFRSLSPYLIWESML